MDSIFVDLVLTILFVIWYIVDLGKIENKDMKRAVYALIWFALFANSAELLIKKIIMYGIK